MSTQVISIPASRARGWLLLLAGAVAACDAPPEVDSIEAEIKSPASHKASIKMGTLSIIGTPAGSRLALRLQSAATLAVDVNDDGSAEFTFDRSRFARISIDAGDGDDVVRMDESGGAFTNEEVVTISGGRGNDTLLGGVGAETFLGGPGNDFVDGGQGADAIRLGDGNDIFNWDPGDGSDVIDGEAGADAVVFNGAVIGEEFDFSASDDRVRLARNIAAITLDIGGVERTNVNARGGADRVVVHDLAGTAMARVQVNLEGVAGSGAGDGQPDAVVVEGTAGADQVTVAAEGAAVVATGLAASVAVTSGEPGVDFLVVNGAGGDRVNVNGSDAADTMEVLESSGHAHVAVAGFNVTVDAFAMAALAINGLGGDDVLRQFSSVNPLPVHYDGGEGRDQVLCGNQADVLIGGPGDDFIDGGPGPDTIALGDGDDTFNWDPGDGSDVVEGSTGNDAVVFNGSNIGEEIELSASGNRLRILRNIGTVSLDIGGIERADVTARGGADRVSVRDLAGSGVARVNVNLESFPGSGTGDAQADAVVIEGTAGADQVTVAAEGAAVVATGLAASVAVTSGEPGVDFLVVNGAGGDQVNVNGSEAADTMEVVESGGHAQVTVAGFNVTVDAFAMAALAINGLGGDDLLRQFSSVNPLPVQFDGGEGRDQVLGGNQADVLIGGPGDDFIDGGPGPDTIALGDGDDTFNWDPGDGSDVVEGGAGNDAVVFSGSAIGEDIELSASGNRLRIVRNIGAVSLDIGGIERATVSARGGSDHVRVRDLTGTGIALVNLDLESSVGSGVPDALQDIVVVDGTSAPDVIAVMLDASTPLVTGLAAVTRIVHPDPFDLLQVNGLGGVDAISLAPGVEALITLVITQD